MSMSKLLMTYLRLAVQEAHLARVPNQLVSDGGHEGEEDEDVGQDVNEFSGCGAAMGYTGPLGGGKGSHPTASVGQRKHRK
jgi:hypothetical protein